MKSKMLLLFLFMTLLAPALLHGETASPELIAKGRALFNKKEGLPVKFACILCHGKGKEIKRARIAGLGDKFPAVINKYVTGKSKGAPLAADSDKMKALQAYILNEHSK